MPYAQESPKPLPKVESGPAAGGWHRVRRDIRHDFTVSFTSEELHELQRVADFRGQLITEYIKAMALSEAYRPQVRVC